jgi:hypothetical protein
MKLFHLAPIGDTKEWFKTLPSQILRTWSEVESVFSATTTTNPKEQCNYITTMSGVVIKECISDILEEE